MKPKYWWIKERHNPQLGLYYVACGQIPVKDARAMGRGSYGYNIMHKFSSASDYEEHLKQIREEGHLVQ